MLLTLLYLTALFVAFTPNILVNFPKKGSVLTRAVVHALLFTAAYQLLNMFVFPLTEGYNQMTQLSPSRGSVTVSAALAAAQAEAARVEGQLFAAISAQSAARGAVTTTQGSIDQQRKDLEKAATEARKAAIDAVKLADTEVVRLRTASGKAVEAVRKIQWDEARARAAAPVAGAVSNSRG
jgi:hypothetical protein